MQTLNLLERVVVSCHVSTLQLPEFLSLQSLQLTGDITVNVLDKGVATAIILESKSIEKLLWLFYECGEQKIKIR